ncbi:uncharacterized protein FIBRA_01545 [Fibroporia radiculosa]|uniref:Uncharacterized protein n=1 Tax=Fibroporia radiculosa TaxID=599839 RepID=J4HTI1_9APHY|nr:uncharacterized protein FIBRA_01545 [Fibroporia radiculosa]CCL99527.1 predicted protein [Fibroporia radiculosa]
MATPPPSQFAALLRQSKFASFDPHIGQVYASYGGHAHRGNWGLKRPLPLRRRKATVTVKTVDSRQQQTEWKSAEPQDRWIKMWDEVGVTPRVYTGPWATKLGPLVSLQWEIDSEFSQGTRDVQDIDGLEQELKKKSKAVPNIFAMSKTERARYMEELREARPEFRKYFRVQQRARERGEDINEAVVEAEVEAEPEEAHPVSLWEQSDNPNHIQEFLERRAAKEYNAPNAHIIEQRPQRFGGLVYASSSQLQSLFLSPPRAGRILQGQGTNTRPGLRLVGRAQDDDMVASFAGMTSSLNKNNRGLAMPVDWSRLSSTGERNPQASITDFRFAQAELVGAPETVAKNPAGIKSVHMRTEVEHCSADDDALTQANPHPPGSREYIAHEGHSTKNTMSMIRSTPKKGASFRASPTAKADLLMTLNKVVESSEPNTYSWTEKPL